MRVFAISDLHLSGRQDKAMDVFGEKWINHFEKIKNDWLEKVNADDIVLISGDISWAMSFEDGLFDLKRIAELPGKKVFIKGNHDYWWQGITTLRRSAPDDTFYFIQNDCVRIENVVIGGTRGWIVPGSQEYNKENEKIYLRECERLKLVFSSIKKTVQEGDKLVCMSHFPPFNSKREDNEFTKIFEENKVDCVVYGHLHGNAGWGYPFECVKNGVEYRLTSCDLLNFKLTQIF